MPTLNRYTIHYPEWHFSWTLADGQLSRDVGFDLLEGRAVLYHAGLLGQSPRHGRKLVDLRNVSPEPPGAPCSCWSAEDPASSLHVHPDCQTAMIDALVRDADELAPSPALPCRSGCPGWQLARDHVGALCLRTCEACWQDAPTAPADYEWSRFLAPSLALHLAGHFPEDLDALEA